MLIITIHNDGTGTEDIGNYDCKVYVNRKLIAEGRIENYVRYFGWQGLVRDIARVVGNFEEKG